MFSGLNKFLKIFLPKRLFYRALIIVAAPTILLQLIITIVFYDSIWIKANKNTTRSLVAQLKTIEEVYQNDKKNLDFLQIAIRTILILKLELIKINFHQSLVKEDLVQWIDHCEEN